MIRILGREDNRSRGDQITLTLAASLPRLNLMRLLVFVRVLQDICSGEPGSPSVRLPTQARDGKGKTYATCACRVLAAQE